MKKRNYLERKKSEIKDALIKLFPKTQSPKPAVKKLHEALKNAHPHKNHKAYKNDNDELADLIIGLKGTLTNDEFLQLPDIDVMTAFYMVIRLNEARDYTDNWQQQIKKELKKLETSKIRRENAKSKYEKYYEKPQEFIDELYKSRAWESKTEAATFIAPLLADYIRENNLPVELTKGKPKSDWYDWVYRNL